MEKIIECMVIFLVLVFACLGFSDACEWIIKKLKGRM